jgi:hypothetical protein
MFDDTVHHLWILPEDPGTEYIRLAAVCSDATKIVNRRDYERGEIDPHFTATDLCAHCVEITRSVSV